MSLLALYQCTHAEVMFSRSARVRIGPLRNGEPLPHALGFVQPDRRFGQRIIEGIPDGPDRRNQSLQHQRLSEIYCGVL